MLSMATYCAKKDVQLVLGLTSYRRRNTSRIPWKRWLLRVKYARRTHADRGLALRKTSYTFLYVHRNHMGKPSILFFGEYYRLWFKNAFQAPCTVNRLYSYAHPDNPSFVLNYLQSFFLPLQGFWNSCIYLSTFPFLNKRFLSWKLLKW